jgi:spoIIIJ-associated protein
LKKIVVSGKTVEEAIETALRRLGARKDQVRVTVLSAPAKGLFGLIGNRPAEVEVQLVSSPVDEAKEFLGHVCLLMGLRVHFEHQEEDDHVLLRIKGENLGLLIGRRGQTLDSLQYLTNLVANKHAEQYTRIVLDAEQYRERRKQTLEQLAERLAAKAVQQRREVVLEPMAAHERKIIHNCLQNRTDVSTKSQGEEPYRKVVIIPKR